MHGPAENAGCGGRGGPGSHPAPTTHRRCLRAARSTLRPGRPPGPARPAGRSAMPPDGHPPPTRRPRRPGSTRAPAGRRTSGAQHYQRSGERAVALGCCAWPAAGRSSSCRRCDRFDPGHVGVGGDAVSRLVGVPHDAARPHRVDSRSLTATLTATSLRAASHAMIVPIAPSETNSRNGLSYGDSEPAGASFPAWWSSTRQVADRVQPGRPWLGVPARSRPTAPGPDRL